MIVKLSKFGKLLISRPAGHEAMLAMKAYFRLTNEQEKIELDFEGVNVVGPSWLHEVLLGLKSEYGENRVVCLPTNNTSVIESLKVIDEQTPRKS